MHGAESESQPACKRAGIGHRSRGIVQVLLYEAKHLLGDRDRPARAVERQQLGIDRFEKVVAVANTSAPNGGDSHLDDFIIFSEKANQVATAQLKIWVRRTRVRSPIGIAFGAFQLEGKQAFFCVGPLIGEFVKLLNGFSGIMPRRIRGRERKKQLMNLPHR